MSTTSDKGNAPPDPGDEEREGLSRIGFVSEEGETPGGATPQKDFASGLVIALLGLAATWDGLVMENPGRSFYTSPGLLPVLIGFSLFLMAFAQMMSAARKGAVRDLLRGARANTRAYFADPENRSALFLIAVVCAYVILVDLISFDLRIPVEGVDIRFSSFEAVTIVVLTYILRVFWKKPVLQCLLVSFLMSTALALTFRLGFQLIMPGVS